MNILTEIPASLANHIPLKQVILQAGIALNAADICLDLGKVLVVCDENTKDFVKLPSERIILAATQKPELTKAQELAKTSPDYFVAVGSGSLNDLVKYAAYLAGKPYIVFATAPSMNGYASANVSLLVDGHKKSFFARAPESVFLDLEILKAAPQRLIISGIGDSICRPCAQADALLSAQVKNTSDYAGLFALMKKYELQIFDDVAALAKTLIFGGLAMLLAKSSAPASGGEHMLAHYMELMQKGAPQSYHGEQIAVTTLTMAKLQQQWLTEKNHVEIGEINETEIVEFFGAAFGKYCLAQSTSKYHGLMGKKIRIDKAAIEEVLRGAENIEQKLKQIGAPLEPRQLGWNENIYASALSYAKYTRDRFTFLDLQ